MSEQICRYKLPSQHPLCWKWTSYFVVLFSAFLGPTTASPASGASTSDSSTNLIPIIAGAVVGVIAVAVIIAVTVYCLKRKKSNVSHIDKDVKGAAGRMMFYK